MQKIKKQTKKRKYVIFLVIILTVSLILGITTVFVGAYSFGIDYSFDEALFASAKSSNITKIYYDSKNGAKSLGAYAPALYEEVYSEATKKQWVSYYDIADTVKNAFVAMEDRGFFEHNGVDVKRTFGAVLNYFFHFKSNFGGSTITQQVIKNISGDDERSIKRKFNEILRSLHIEYSHSKEEIFEVYLNIVGMSENIVGVGEASELYFGKPIKDLDYCEAAMLVGIANAPSRYNPYRHPEECKKKRNKVLYSLMECGYIDNDYYYDAINRDLGVIPKKENTSEYNSWFTETVCNDVARDLSAAMGVSSNVARKLVLSGGFHIYTTVSPEIQSILSDYFENLDNFPAEVENGLEYSMVVSEAETGNLMAIIGGVGKKSANRILNYGEVNITPGSTLKPLALYAPLIDSKKIHWASVFDDVPLEFNMNSNGEYTAFPKNSPAVYDGLTTVKDAIKVSKNTIAVRLYNLLGAEKIYSNLKNSFGFDSLVRRESNKNGGIITDLSVSPLALGQLSHGVSLRKLTEAYNVFPNEGVLPKSRSYLAVIDSNGEILIENFYNENRVFAKESARIMNKLLETVVDEGTAKKVNLSEFVDTAGKTGTSGGERDKLFVGYTPYFTAGIWCGYKGEKKAVGPQSISHLEIWDEVMQLVYKSKEIYDGEEKSFSVSGLEYLPYCKDSGKLYSENCLYDPRGARLEYGYFTKDNLPKDLCDRHYMCKYDSLSGGIAHKACDERDTVDIALIRIEDRSFPCEVIITDAEFVFRDLAEDIPLADSYDVPYFYYALSPGEYVGTSKGKKQFNSACYIHKN